MTRTRQELLDDLTRRGLVVVVISADKVEVRGELDNLTDELRSEILHHKPDIIANPPRLTCLCTVDAACWGHSPDARPVRDTRIAMLVDGLRASQAWLNKADERLGPDMWSDVALAEQICVALAEWQVRETWLRNIGFTGCIWQPNRCPTDAVEVCFSCRTTDVPEWRRTPDNNGKGQGA